MFYCTPATHSPYGASPTCPAARHAWLIQQLLRRNKHHHHPEYFPVELHLAVPRSKIQNRPIYRRQTNQDISYLLQNKGKVDFTESQNHRIVGIGRDLCGSSSPTPQLSALCFAKATRLSTQPSPMLQAGNKFSQPSAKDIVVQTTSSVFQQDLQLQKQLPLKTNKNLPRVLLKSIPGLTF